MRYLGNNDLTETKSRKEIERVVEELFLETITVNDKGLYCNICNNVNNWRRL